MYRAKKYAKGKKPNNYSPAQLWSRGVIQGVTVILALMIVVLNYGYYFIFEAPLYSIAWPPLDDELGDVVWRVADLICSVIGRA